jgi:hypothetical protein
MAHFTLARIVGKRSYHHEIHNPDGVQYGPAFGDASGPRDAAPWLRALEDAFKAGKVARDMELRQNGDSSRAVVHRYLDLSTSHLDAETAFAMSEGSAIPQADDAECFVSYQAITSRDDGEQYGHLVPVLMPEDGEKHWPQCMRDCLALARELGCDYIRFDRDAETAAGLPFYEW